MLQARPTTYRGIRMRSRLEARVAAFLDQQVETFGISWVYEPMAFAGKAGQYLPDFEVADPAGGYLTYLEVKPTIEAALSTLARMQVIWESDPDVALVVMVPDCGVFRTRRYGRPWVWRRWI